MRKKKVFALAMAGCMMFTQPVFAEELQKELTDAVVISDDAQKEGNLDVLSEDGEKTFFVNGSSSEAAEAERANFAERAAEEGKTGNSVLLDRNAVTYLEGHREIPCEEQGGIYFLNRNKLSLYKPDSNELTEVHQFDNVQDVYVANDRLYILDRSSNITIYNLLTQQEEKKLQYGDHASSIGQIQREGFILPNRMAMVTIMICIFYRRKERFYRRLYPRRQCTVFAASMKVTGTIM